jgi:hypothetical protein
VIPLPLLAVGSFLKSIPWQVYAILAVVVGLGIAHVSLVREAVARNDAKWVGRLEEQKRRQDAADAKAKHEIAALQSLYTEATARHEASLKAVQSQRLQELTKLKERLAAYVTPLQLARCNDVPRGYLLFRSDAAAFANSRPIAGAAEAPADPVDSPSGVSLESLAEADAAQAAAYRTCADRDAAWRKYHMSVEEWAASVRDIYLNEKGNEP